MTEVLGERLLSRVPFRELGFSRLFSDYCEAVPGAVSFFGSHFLDKTAIADSLAKARSVNRDGRSVLVDVLQEQNARWQAPQKTHDNIRLLESGQASCVVTGQQLGLFVSPLYTIYKSLTAIQLASAWTTEAKPVVPVFWLADEDHDLDEIDHCFVPSSDGLPTSIVYPESRKGNTQPTGRIVLDEDVVRAIDEFSEVLPRTSDSTFLIESLRNCYRPGTSLADAFASFLHVLLPNSGLIVISGDDARLKRLAVPLFGKAITQADELNRILETASTKIAQDYHAQLHLRNTNLFVIADGHRLGLDRTSSGLSISGSNEQFTVDQIVKQVDTDPASFSPNVVLRPLYQDSILPTAAYVGGPGEVAYFGQIREAYNWANVHMPIIYPRASLSLVDGSASRLLNKYQLTLSDLRRRPEALFGQLVSQQMTFDSHGAVSSAKKAVSAALADLADPVGNVDPTLLNSIEAIRVTINKRLEKLEKKILREEKRKHDTMGLGIERTTSFLFPSGKPQERTFAPAYFVGRFGRDYFMRLLQDIDIDTSHHLIIRA